MGDDELAGECVLGELLLLAATNDAVSEEGVDGVEDVVDDVEDAAGEEVEEVEYVVEVDAGLLEVGVGEEGGREAGG